MSKSKGTFQKKHMCCKHTETKLVLLFIIIPFDFNIPIPAFQEFLILSGKKFFGCIFNQFYYSVLIPDFDVFRTYIAF